MAGAAATISLRFVARAHRFPREAVNHAAIPNGRDACAHQHDGHRSWRGCAECDCDANRECGAIWSLSAPSVTWPNRSGSAYLTLLIADGGSIAGNDVEIVRAGENYQWF